ncbi:MAG: Fumarylacetoacetate hydrolase [Dehalococcoidia bacterium]|nr:Fumarylacetoacetate hydrolase [Dehalococcoidia bacterium]
MKFVLFEDGRPGLLKDRGVVDIGNVVRELGVRNGQAAMEAIITNMDAIRAELSRLEQEGEVVPLSSVAFQAPLPKPGKILCMGGNFTEFGHRAPGPMWGFLKSSEAVVGPRGTVILPPDDANIFHHEAELVLVFGRAGKDVKEDEAMDYVFGYTCGVDVSARMPAAQGGGPTAFRAWRGVSAGKSFPTFAPIGPAIVTKDQVSDPQRLQIRLSVNDELRGDFNTSDMAHSIAKSIAFVSSFESFGPGDILYTGTNHQGLGAMQDGDNISIEIDEVGGFTFTVQDPLKRRWQRGIDEETAEDVRQGAGGPGRRKRPL